MLVSMSDHDSVLDREALGYVRGLMKPRQPKDEPWKLLGIMALLAVSALTLATVMVLSPAPGLGEAPETATIVNR